MDKPKAFEFIKCPLGCSLGDELVLTGHDRIHNIAGEFKVVKCSTCGLLRTNPRPTPEAMGSYYPDDYGPYVGTRIQQSAASGSSGIKEFFRPYVRWIFNSKTSVLPAMPPGRLLEIGCASGSFLHSMAGQGWDVTGIEFSEEAAQTARQHGHEIHTGALEDAPAPEKPFDLIVGWMVLEHLHEPVTGLRKLREWAKPDAWLVLSVPNAGALEFTFFKGRWYALHLPNHLYHFTPETLEKVLAAAGWKLIKVHHQRNLSNLFVSLAYSSEDKGWLKIGQWFRRLAYPSGVLHYLLFPLAWVFSVFKQTGRMTVWASKIND